MSSYKTITVERKGQVEVLSLNRPAQLNALSLDMCLELLTYFSRLETDELTSLEPELNPRVIVLRGNGPKAFCAGLDLTGGSTVDKSTDIASFNFQRRIAQIIMVMRRIKQPIIGLCHGAAAGGGFALMLACDIVLSTKNARFNVAMAKIGLTGCDVGISYFLPRKVGPNVAAHLMMTGKFLSAERGHQLGFITDMYETKEELDKHGLDLAHHMIETTPPMALCLTKEGLRHSINAPDLESAIAMEDRQQLLMLKSKDLVVYMKKGFKKSKGKL